MAVTKLTSFNISYRKTGTSQGSWVRTTKSFDRSKGEYKLFRSWQEEAYSKLRTSGHWAVFAPMGAGKSVLIHALLHRKLLKNPKLRAIIAVPQTIIAHSFDEPVKLQTEDGKYDCSINHNFFDDPNSTIRGLINFLTSGYGHDVFDRIALCSHAALVQAFSKAPDVFHDLVIVLDEAHHSQFVEIEKIAREITNGLGATIRFALSKPKKNIQLGISTATFFRGDLFPIIPKAQFERHFDVVNYAFDRHLKENCNFSTFGYDFLLYKSAYIEATKDIFKKRINKTIVFIPPVNSRLSRQKHNDVIEIYKSIAQSSHPKWKDITSGPDCGLTLLKRGSKWIKVVNLVDIRNREAKKRLIKLAHDSQAGSSIDVVIALGMFKEGANWKWAEDVVVIGAKGSLQEHIQILGRLFRPAPSKEHVRVHHVLPFTLDCLKDGENSDVFNDYLKAVLLSMLFEDIFTPPNLMPNPEHNTSKRTEKSVNLLAEIPIDKRERVFRNTILECTRRNAQDFEFNQNKEKLRFEVKKIIEKNFLEEGVTQHLDVITEQMWKFIRGHAVKCARAIDLKDINIRLVEEDPANIILMYTARDCGYRTLQELREQYSLFINSADENKRRLLEMAKRGEPKPVQTHQLGKSFASYIYPTSGCYDPTFTATIKKIAPEWLVNTAEQNKLKLIKLAQTGAGRPSNRTQLGSAFQSYIRPSQTTYDPDFLKMITEVAPGWFADVSAENKKQLIEMAKRGEPIPHHKKHPLGAVFRNYIYGEDQTFKNKILEIAPDWITDSSTKIKNTLIKMAKDGNSAPSWKTKLGNALMRYTRSSYADYDLRFEKQIKSLAPHWFIDRVEENKKKLLLLAKRKGARPRRGKHPLGQIFASYINKSSECYDQKFKREVEKLVPEWFQSESELRKEELLKLAAKHKTRPSGRTAIGNALFRYTNPKKGQYDKEFTKKISKLAPGWFSDSVAERKAQLLQMAVRGENRPHSAKHALGGSLCHYTLPSQPSYDPVFHRKIKKLAPHWFKKGRQ
jgi:hypothetical protein